MIKHIVMWTIKDTDSISKEENKNKLVKELNDLPVKISQIKKFEVGLNFNTSDAAYDIVLYSEFESRDDLNIYQKHPDHVKVAELVGRIRDKRAVVDYIDG